MGTYWKKSTPQAAVASIVIGSVLRMILYFIISTAPPESPYFAYAGLDTMIPPIVSFAVFVAVSYATYKKTPSRHDVIYLIPSEEDVVTGADVSEWVNPIDVRQRPSRK
jgi:Na+/proline symporter